MDFVTARLNMVDSQVRTNDVTHPLIQQAMRTVARERFCAPAREFAAYAETEVEIAPGRVLMRPRDVAKLMQAARIEPGARALALAAPYAAAVLSSAGLKVDAQEADARAAAVLEPALEDYGVRLRVQDLAKPVGRGYDLIVCEGAVADVPKSWIMALKEGGELAVVVRDGPVGKARVYVRIGDTSAFREVFDSTPPVLEGFERKPSFQF